MKHRILIISGLVMMFTIFLPQSVFHVSANKTKPLASYILELYDLQKYLQYDGGECNISTYSITNEGDGIASPIIHGFYLSNQDWTVENPEYEYTSPDLDPGQTDIIDLATITGLSDGFEGYVIVASSQWLSGTVIPLPPCYVSITGPNQGLIDHVYVFHATTGLYAIPSSFTYTWSVTDHSDVIHEKDYFIDILSISWANPGQKEITVTAENEGGIETETFTITIFESFNVYLPLSMR